MVSRRRLLQVFSAASLGALAGCPSPPSPPGFDDTETEDNSSQTPTSTPKPLEGVPGVKPSDPPPTIPPHDCTVENRIQHKPFVDFGEVVLGETEDWKMQISDTTLAIGQAFTISLRNKTDYAKKTDSKWNFNLQLYTTEGWQEIRYVKHQPQYSSNKITHQGNQGFTWEFLFTEDGLLVGHPHAERILICPALQPGRYRFIFSNPSISVQFNVVER